MVHVGRYARRRVKPQRFFEFVDDIRRPDLKILKDHLLSRGGEGFQFDWVLRSEIDPRMVRRLLVGGKFIEGRNAELCLMEQSRCHQNVKELISSGTYEPWTGLALSDDGIWRIHSWAVSRDTGKIVETTEPRTLYFGIQEAPY